MGKKRETEGLEPTGARAVFFLVPERDPAAAAAAAAASVSHALDPIKQPRKQACETRAASFPPACVSLHN